MNTARPTLPTSVSILEPFVHAGVFGPFEVHLAATVTRACGLTSSGADTPDQDHDADLVILAVAAVAAGLTRGHVCLEVASIPERLFDPETDEVDDIEAEPLAWPTPERWCAALAATTSTVALGDDAAAVPVRPLVLAGSSGDPSDALVYLHRSWLAESRILAFLDERVAADSGGRATPGPEQIDAALAPLFGTDPNDRQREACVRALGSRVSFITGGPGTGKTYTIARLLVAAFAIDPSLEADTVALAAPTGKAAARLSDALERALDEIGDDDSVAIDAEIRERLGGVAHARTLHKLLGLRAGSLPTHDGRNPLPQRLVIVDEASMIDVAVMAWLLDALASDARLVVVGDPFQLASVEAGTVLSDIVAAGEGDARAVTRLVENRRVDADAKAILGAADAIRRGDLEAFSAVVAASSAGPEAPVVEVIDPDDATGRARLTEEVAAAAAATVEAASAGDAASAIVAMAAVKVLAATRRGRGSVQWWNREVERRLEGSREQWYVGRPLLITHNDYDLEVFNGDTGVVVSENDERVSVAIDRGGSPELISPSWLVDLETWWAMTIHKSQGSEFGHVVVSLPDRVSPILTRELLYTAITRAKRRVSIIASQEVLAHTINTPISRASGLQRRIAQQPTLADALWG